MNLKISDIAILLNISEKTVYRWLKAGKIPAYKINGQYRFDKGEIDKWIIEKKLNSAFTKPKSINLPSLIKKGGIYKINGSNITDTIYNMTKVISLPEDIDKSLLSEKLLMREELVSTAIGNGIAVPHPMESLIHNPENEAVYLFLLDKAIDYHALDEKKVNVLFLILTTKNRHLEIISKISYLSKDSDFVKLINKDSNYDDILEYITEKKKKWDKILSLKQTSNNKRR